MSVGYRGIIGVRVQITQEFCTALDKEPVRFCDDTYGELLLNGATLHGHQSFILTYPLDIDGRPVSQSIKWDGVGAIKIYQTGTAREDTFRYGKITTSWFAVREGLLQTEIRTDGIEIDLQEKNIGAGVQGHIALSYERIIGGESIGFYNFEAFLR